MAAYNNENDPEGLAGYERGRFVGSLDALTAVGVGFLGSVGFTRFTSAVEGLAGYPSSVVEWGGVAIDSIYAASIASGAFSETFLQSKMLQTSACIGMTLGAIGQGGLMSWQTLLAASTPLFASELRCRMSLQQDQALEADSDSN